MARTESHRKYQLTINNPIEHGFDHETVKTILQDFAGCIYWCMLLALKAEEAANRKSFGHAYIESSYIFKWASGELFKPNYITKRFPKLLRAHKLPHIRFHDLRHSCASLLIAAGYGLKDVQDWLGHSDITVTANTYAHIDVKRKQGIADAIASSVGVRRC